MKIRWSYYTDIHKNDNIVILNKLSNDNIIGVTYDTFAAIEKFIENPFKCNDNLKRIISELYIKNFVVDASISQEEEISEFLDKRNNTISNSASIYFMPTLDCNMRCTYCAIGNVTCINSNKKMSNECIEQTVKFLESNQYIIAANNLSVVLFGGEPSLAFQENIKFIKLLNNSELLSHKVNYLIVTNGYAWTEKQFDILIENKISNFQITLDGPQIIHDRRRINAFGEGTFNRIIQNIYLLKDKPVNIVIRINVDEQNCLFISQLLKDLSKEGLEKRVSIQIAPVDPSHYSNSNGYSPQILNSYYDIYKNAFELGFYVCEWKRSCSIYNAGFLAVDPDGYLYKCPEEVGQPMKIIGDVYNGFNETLQERIKPCLRKKCNQCKYLKLCNGGCVTMREVVGKEFCFKEPLSIIRDSYLTNKYNSDMETLRKNEIKNMMVSTL